MHSLEIEVDGCINGYFKQNKRIYNRNIVTRNVEGGPFYFGTSTYVVLDKSDELGFPLWKGETLV